MLVCARAFALRINLLFIAILLAAPMGEWAQDAEMGGGFEESRVEEESPGEGLVPAEPAALDSGMFIPAWDMYGIWDTRNIHAYAFNGLEMTDSVNLVLRHDSCDYTLPFRGRITSNFGERGHKYHYGIDIKLYKGDPVRVAFEGVVRIAQYSSSYGNVVVVRHNNGLETLYAHLSARKCKPGDHVESGDIIGLGGNTGRSTGSHLHFEARFMGEPIDPNSIIDWEAGALVTDTLEVCSHSFHYLKEIRSKKYHTIRSGDTLYGIARRYGTSAKRICNLNGMSMNATIYAGRRLRVR